jgi:hypothetical protein
MMLEGFSLEAGLEWFEHPFLPMKMMEWRVLFFGIYASREIADAT